MRVIKYLAIHCTAGPQDQPTGSIQAYWRNVKGWNSPGYHFLISGDGTVENLQPIEKLSNGVAGFNTNAIHFCYKGGVITNRNDPEHSKGTPIDNRTPAQKEALKQLITDYNQKFPSAIILGHRDFSPDKNRNGIIEPHEWIKACPSFSVSGWLKQINFKSASPVHVISVTRDGVNFRSGPGLQFPKIAPSIRKGEKVKRVSVVDGWAFVKYGGLKGWMNNDYL